MLVKEQLHSYQDYASDHIINSNYSMQWLEMGLGKTIVTLTAIDELFSRLAIKSVLIVAPIRVCQTVWRQEAKKWQHTKWLKFSMVTGDADTRRRALTSHHCQIFLVNYENLVWLQRHLEAQYTRRGRYLPFDMIVFDEISKLKNTRTRQGAERGKAALKMLPYIPRRVGLTGTPSSNGMLDLFGQYLVLDSGTRLGTSFSDYRAKYFIGDGRYKFNPGFGAVEAIKTVIGDITLSMRSKDYLDMPEIITNDIMLDLTPELQETYDAIEREMVVQLESGGTVEVFNQASLINRCLQFTNGAMYKEPGMPDWETIHDIKLDALSDIVEEMAGQPLLVAFEFQHDAHKILKRFPDAVWFSAKMSEKEAINAIENFKSGRLQMLIGHPGSMGHGLDGLQDSCFTEVLYGLNWSLDLMQQTIARVWRQGQKRPVIIHRLLMDNTADLAVKEALERKASDETSIKTAVMDYWRKKAH